MHPSPILRARRVPKRWRRNLTRASAFSCVANPRCSAGPSPSRRPRQERVADAAAEATAVVAVAAIAVAAVADTAAVATAAIGKKPPPTLQPPGRMPTKPRNGMAGPSAATAPFDLIISA